MRGLVQANAQDWRDSTTITLSDWSVVLIDGYAMEGHPNEGCIDGVSCNGKDQAKEEFKLLFDEQEVARYLDQGLYRNGWFPFGPWQTATFGPGEHVIALEHLHFGEPGIGYESVEYKLSVCVVTVASPTPTMTSAP